MRARNVCVCVHASRVGPGVATPLMLACVHACVCACTYVWICVCTHMYSVLCHACVCAHVCARVYMYIYTYVCTCMCLCMWMCAGLPQWVYTVHTYMYLLISSTASDHTGTTKSANTTSPPSKVLYIKLIIIYIYVQCMHHYIQCNGKKCRNVHICTYCTICKICAPLFYKKSCHTFMVGAGNVGIRKLRRFLPNMPQFLPNAPQFGEHTAFSRQKAAHCDTAVKLRRTQWEKSGAHAAMFSSAAAARLFNSF